MTHQDRPQIELDPDFLAALASRPRESSTTFAGASFGGAVGGVARTREAVPMPQTPDDMRRAIMWGRIASGVLIVLSVAFPPVALLALAAVVFTLYSLHRRTVWRRETREAVEAHLGWNQFGRAA